MAENGGGIIINISSDLGIIAPDQRLYEKNGLSDKNQPVKPVTYSVVKHGLIGLTKYLATYWADKGIRVNCLCPGGVFDKQENSFLKKGIETSLREHIKNFKRQALHAYNLEFTHPISKKIISLKAELPDDMNNLINILEMHD
mgnify:CR=1 FL=1